ncbi:MAG: hypothetical protein [Bacteriophage sp.]|nr:MAG: hypothetical protein [Bacteriophage sp.]
MVVHLKADFNDSSAESPMARRALIAAASISCEVLAAFKAGSSVMSRRRTATSSAFIASSPFPAREARPAIPDRASRIGVRIARSCAFHSSRVSRML